MWIRYQILVFSCFTAKIWTEEQQVTDRDRSLKMFWATNGSESERTRFRRNPFQEHFCRDHGCCAERDDACSTHFSEMNTICYCDQFCEREHSDCCPDYHSFCSGKPGLNPRDPIHVTPWPLKGCLRDGQHYEGGAVIKENCNYCTCSEEQWECSVHICLVRPELIQQVNKRNYGWRAHNYSQFWGKTLEDGLKHHLGTFPPSPSLLRMNELTVNLPSDIHLPEFFQTAYKWPGWIHQPLNQKDCAASWAFSTASVAADRIAIQSNGYYTANLSPQNLISCCFKHHHGCNGGNIDKAWWYLRKRGLVSHMCYPLSKDQKSNHSGCEISSRTDGRGKRHATKPCPNNIEKSNHIYQCTPPYRISSNETEIMKEIMQNGPVQAIMQVHDDFFHYKTGIYRHITNISDESENYKQLRTHSVKLTGWGTLRNAYGKKKNFGLLPIPGEIHGERMAISGFYVEKMSLTLKS